MGKEARERGRENRQDRVTLRGGRGVFFLFVPSLQIKMGNESRFLGIE